MLSPGENRMQSIVGTWKLLHATARDAAGAAHPLPYGGKALGRLTLTANGRMMSVVCDGRTELPAGVRREYSSYCGNYTYGWRAACHAGCSESGCSTSWRDNSGREV